jgi:hypothetical protein
MPNWRFFPDRRGRNRRAGRAIWISVVAATGMQGCAFTYTDATGGRRTIGLVDMTVMAPADPETLAGDVVEVTSLGLSIGQNAQGGYVTAGYNRQTTAALRDNALVIGNPVTALVPARRTDAEIPK